MKKLLYLIFLINISLFSQENKILSYTIQTNDDFKCNSSLYIVKNESIYRVEDNRENGLQEKQLDNGDYVTVNNDATSKIFYSTKDKSIVRIPLYKGEVIYSDVNSNTAFVFTGKTKKIGEFNCQEAKLNSKGRKYTIWFTEKIEIPFGPYKINGLPGLIVELLEETNNVKITLNSIRRLEDTKHFEIYKNYVLSKSVLSYEEYTEKIVRTMTQMKIKKLALAKELGAEITFDNDQRFFTTFLIDIPANLVTELQKIN